MNLTFRTGKGGSVAKDMVLTEKNCTMFKHRFSKVITVSTNYGALSRKGLPEDKRTLSLCF